MRAFLERLEAERADAWTRALAIDPERAMLGAALATVEISRQALPEYVVEDSLAAGERGERGRRR